MPILIKNKFQFARKLIKSNLQLNGCEPIRSWKYCRKSPFEATIVELCSGQTRFSSEFSGQLYNVFFFAFFSGLLDWILLILLWFERPLPPDRWLSCSWPFKTDDVTSSRRDMGGCGGSATNGVTANKKWVICFKFCLLTSLDKNEP